MIQSFIIQHIDALIMTVGGVFATWYGVAKGDQRIKRLKILGPCLILIGLGLLFVDGATPADWRFVSTGDGVAGAEFPGPPEANDQTQTLQGQSVRTVGWVYIPTGKDVSFRLSYSDAPPEESKIPPADRLASSKEFFISQGFRVVAQGEGTYGDAKGYSLQLAQDSTKAALWLRVVYAEGRTYRVVASAGQRFSNDPVILRFLDSFRVRSAVPQP